MPDGLTRMMTDHAPMVRRLARRMRGAAHTTPDDIVQDVFLSVWRQVRQGRQIAYPASYVYRTARREAWRALRRQPSSPAPIDLDDLPALNTGPEDRLLRAQFHQQVRSALSQLPRDRRRAVVRHLAGASIAELMADTGWTYQRARNLVARGLRDLRQMLAGAGDDAGASPRSGASSAEMTQLPPARFPA
ncbi:MAG: sigma-70 family RNA polymerase sigma factor [Acidobacteria bacterium]|nr:sigma-70 family RNA polymerase sigma factor [Acidobacteriota bacterium]